VLAGKRDSPTSRQIIHPSELSLERSQRGLTANQIFTEGRQVRKDLERRVFANFAPLCSEFLSVKQDAEVCSATPSCRPMNRGAGKNISFSRATSLAPLTTLHAKGLAANNRLKLSAIRAMANRSRPICYQRSVVASTRTSPVESGLQPPGIVQDYLAGTT